MILTSSKVSNLNDLQASVTARWEIWCKTVEKGAHNVSYKLIELARIEVGNKVLDIATGIGEPTL